MAEMNKIKSFKSFSDVLAHEATIKLAVENNISLEEIFGSDTWENFFQKLVNDPDNCSYMCKKKCGVDFTPQEIEIRKAEEKLEVARQAGVENY